jgi:heme exporter protein B
MTRWCSVVALLVKKEWRLEWRGRELLTLLVCNAVLFSALVGAGVSSAVLDSATTQKLFPVLLWVVFLLSATTAVSRFNEQELEGRGFEGLLLSGVSGAQMYISKVVVMALFFFASFALLVGLLGGALDQDLSTVFSALLFIGGGASVALASLLTLLAAVASTSKLKGIILPIISIPVLFPVFFGGLEMTTQVVLDGAIAEGSPWPLVILCAQALYLVCGINLFEVALRE